MQTEKDTMSRRWTMLALVGLVTAATIEVPAAFSWPQTAAPTVSSARIWDGRNAEFEAFIRDAPIDHIDVVPIGVTHPKRAFFKPGGLVESVAWKVLPPG